jgi:Uma2 family endonuclease
MATVVRQLEGDLCIQVPATWGAYLRLLRSRGENPNPRYIYCDRRLTIVTRGYPHERRKLLLSWFIETILAELHIPFSGSGEMTLKQGRPKKKGAEGDTSYYLTNLERIRGKKKLVMGVDPAPDLLVEVVVSHPIEDALSVYGAFGVREVWVLDDGGMTFLVLGDGGRYEPSPVSALLPFLSSEELGSWVAREDLPDEGALRLAFREWVTATLAPRREAAGGGGAIP